MTLAAFSIYSAFAISQNDADTRCREGMVLVFREISNKYVCVTQETAQKWVKLGIAVLVEETKQESSEEMKHEEDAALKIQTVPVTDKIAMLIGVGGFTGGNVGVSAGEDGLLIVDDGIAPALEEIKTQLEELKTCVQCGDVVFLINTHWHFDHVEGNEHFGKQGAVIVAHDNVRVLLSSPQEFKSMGMKFAAYPKEALPVVTFDESVSLHFNGEEIQVTHLPNGHTNSDSIVYFTGSNVLHTGDLFFNGMFPFVDLEHGGSVKEMTKNVEEIINVFPEDVKIIPGHGELADMEDLKSYHTMLVETTKIVQDQMNNGKSLEEIQAAGLPEKWKSWEWEFDESSWIKLVYASLQM